MITKTRQKARPFAISRWSVQRKLVLAFWLVSVIPTMIAAELAATTLSQIFDSNVRIWLQESTKIVKDEIGDILHDNARMAKLFLRYASPPSNRQAAKHDRLAADIAEATDIDVVALIRSSDHRVVFSTAPDDIVKQINLTSNAALQTVQVAGVNTGIVVSTFETSQDGVDYVLLVATYLDSSFLTSVADVHSLDLRLYLANPGGFSEFSRPALHGSPLAHPERRRSRDAQQQATQRTVHQQIQRFVLADLQRCRRAARRDLQRPAAPYQPGRAGEPEQPVRADFPAQLGTVPGGGAAGVAALDPTVAGSVPGRERRDLGQLCPPCGGQRRR